MDKSADVFSISSDSHDNGQDLKTTDGIKQKPADLVNNNQDLKISERQHEDALDSLAFNQEEKNCLGQNSNNQLDNKSTKPLNEKQNDTSGCSSYLAEQDFSDKNMDQTALPRGQTFLTEVEEKEDSMHENKGNTDLSSQVEDCISFTEDASHKGERKSISANTKDGKQSVSDSDNTTPRNEEVYSTESSVQSIRGKDGNKHRDKTEFSEPVKSKPKMGKLYGFRLTPEEQEIAYKLKANLLKKVQEQNNHLQAEITLNKQHQKQRKQQSRSAKPKPEDGVSHTNAVKLMKMYEKKAREAESRVQQLEAQLVEAKKLAQRYHDQYVGQIKGRQCPPSKKEKSTVSKSQSERNDKTSDQSSSSCSSSSSKESSKNNDCSNDEAHGRGSNQRQISWVTEDDLDDDEAVFKRHVARLADTKSINGTSPIRVQDIVRKNDMLFMQNEDLKLEVQRLRSDNTKLLITLRRAEMDKDQILHNIGTSEANRNDLLKRLEKEQEWRKKVERFLTRQAANTIFERNEAEAKEEQRKWTQIQPLSPLGAMERTYSHPVKRNIDTPRQMYPVERYSAR